MDKTRLSFLFSFVFFVLLVSTNTGCGIQVGVLGAAYEGIKPEPYGDVKGYMFEVGETKGGSAETPAYLPEKIKFELVKRLRERGLLTTPSESEKRLIVNIVTKESFPPFTYRDYYSEIESHIHITDIHEKEIISKTVLHSAFGSLNVDFAEITHARAIADFLESVVR